MKKSSHTKGREAEDEAVKFLKEKGYTILERNWRYSRNELDIIAKADNTIRIVEVKSRANEDYGSPTESVDYKKRRIIVETADHFMSKFSEDLEVRFDIIGVIINGGKTKIEYFPDAFTSYEI